MRFIVARICVVAILSLLCVGATGNKYRFKKFGQLS